jgi:hypothetical protein
MAKKAGLTPAQQQILDAVQAGPQVFGAAKRAAIQFLADNKLVVVEVKNVKRGKRETEEFLVSLPAATPEKPAARKGSKTEFILNFVDQAPGTVTGKDVSKALEASPFRDTQDSASWLGWLAGRGLIRKVAPGQYASLGR